MFNQKKKKFKKIKVENKFTANKIDFAMQMICLAQKSLQSRNTSITQIG